MDIGRFLPIQFLWEAFFDLDRVDASKGAVYCKRRVD